MFTIFRGRRLLCARRRPCWIAGVVKDLGGEEFRELGPDPRREIVDGADGGTTNVGADELDALISGIGSFWSFIRSKPFLKKNLTGHVGIADLVAQPVIQRCHLSQSFGAESSVQIWLLEAGSGLAIKAAGFRDEAPDD